MGTDSYRWQHPLLTSTYSKVLRVSISASPTTLTPPRCYGRGCDRRRDSEGGRGRDLDEKERQCPYYGQSKHISKCCREKFGKPSWIQT